MKIIYSSGFYKKFKKLSELDKEATRETIGFFQDHPHDLSLRNHPLTGSMTGKRSITVRDDLRIIFVERGGYIQVLMLDIGTHHEVYFD